MIIEARLYSARPMKLQSYLDAFERDGYPIIRRFATLYGYWIAETGPLNRFLHLWRYDGLSDRAARRSALSREPEWADYLHLIEPFLESQRNWIFQPQGESTGWGASPAQTRAFAFSFVRAAETLPATLADSTGFDWWLGKALSGAPGLSLLGRAYGDLGLLEASGIQPALGQLSSISTEIFWPAGFSPLR